MKNNGQNFNSNALDTHIHWVCADCGMKALKLKYNKKCKAFSVSTYHHGICDVCGQNKAVTETRDFGYPRFRKRSSDE